MSTTRTPTLALAAALLALACSGDDDAVGPSDGGGPDGGGTADAGGPRAGFGAACVEDEDCGGRLFCDPQVDLSYLADDLPPGVDAVPSSVFPDGMCSPVPAGPYDPSGETSCDPLVPGPLQGCGRDGVCIALSLEDETWVACRPRCEPSAGESGCDRRFYTCDFDLEACVEGCQSDEECRLRLLDGNGDGVADSLAYDDDSRAECDLRTYRCTHPGASTAETGDPCERLDDCEPDGSCVQPAQTFAGHSFPGGACTKIGCDVEGRECSGENAVCARLRSFTSGLITATACLQGCTVGAEPEADRLGPDGHGEGCRPGYRCHYNGGAGAESGVCVGGNYNDVTENNVGAACQRDADCYSPYGLGQCLRLSLAGIAGPTGTCTIMDCNAPGIPDDVCGANGECIGLNGDLTFCAQRCSAAEECAEGYACADDDGNPATERICYPVCFGDEDCRKEGERCEGVAQMGAGSCVASGG